MEIKIILKRKASKEVHDRLTPVLIDLRSLAMKHEGYISGETLMNMDDPEEVVVISTWKNLKCWDSWVESSERKELQLKVDKILGTSTYYQVYCYG